MVFKRVVLILCLLGVLGALLFMAVRGFAVSGAGEIADEIIAQAYDEYQPKNDEQKVEAIARVIYQRFEKKDVSDVPLLRFRPYLTNHRLPKSVRFPDGVMEMHIGRGLCDNASRMLAFVIGREGISSVQWNMVTDVSGHSALLVTLSDGGDFLVDPYLGFVVRHHGEVIHPHKAQVYLASGENFDAVFEAFEENADEDFYRDIGNMRMAAAGDELVIDVTLPRVGADGLVLGAVDGQSGDVVAASVGHDMSMYLDYMGHRYNREWVRVIEAIQPIVFSMTLVDAPEDGVIVAKPKPRIEGKRLIWELQAGESIAIHDGDAKLSLRRLNSYIGVDQISIMPFGG